MVKLTVLFTVIATSSILVDKTARASNVDVEDLLQNLQQQIRKEQDRAQKKPELVDEVDDGGTYGSLNSKDLSRLLGLSSPASSDKFKSIEVRGNPRDLEQYLLSRQPSAEELLPNNIGNNDNNAKSLVDFQDVSSEEDDARDVDNPNGYSKIYVVLNSDAIKKTRNKDKLNTLLTSLLQQPDRNDRKQEHRYKGFVLSNDAIMRRIGRDSGEKYAREDNMERPSRVRESRGREGGGGGGYGHGRGGGGGGAVGGRTAIPYIRQRGNIYERDD